MMTLEDAEKVLESLEELSVDVENFSWGPSYALAKKRQSDAIKIMKKFIKAIKHARTVNL